MIPNTDSLQSNTLYMYEPQRKFQFLHNSSEIPTYISIPLLFQEILAIREQMTSLPQSLYNQLLYFNMAEINRQEIIMKLHLGMRVLATKLITGVVII